MTGFWGIALDHSPQTHSDVSHSVSECDLSPSGPDICGPGTKKVHVIFTYKGKNLLIKKDIRCKDDQFTHVYTLVVRPDNTYEVLIDTESAQKGSLEEDWDFLPPKMINDPDAKKPEDWDDNPKIDDPEDVKPEVCVVVGVLGTALTEVLYARR